MSKSRSSARGLTWIRRILLGLAGLLAILAALAFAALRDNPARSATGERRTTESGEAVVHYFVSGSGGGMTVMLLPSYGRSASDFNELVSTLNRSGYRTLAVQPRGIDGSTLPSLQVTLHTFAADLAAIAAVESAGTPVVVIGHAYGNRIARAFAERFPDRTRALILLAAGGERPTPPEVASAITRALFSIWPERQREEAIHAAFFAESNPVDPNWMRGWYPRAGLAQASATTRTPYAEWGGGGNAPILVLEPGHDAVAAGAGVALANRYPDRVNVEIIEDAGHALLPEQPDRISGAVLAFLEHLEGSGRAGSPNDRNETR